MGKDAFYFQAILVYLRIENKRVTLVTNWGRIEIIIDNFTGLLLGVNLFNSFLPHELVHMFNSTNSKITLYNKGQIIHLQNEICNTMDIVLQGKAAVQKIDEEGNILKIDTFSEGNILGANLLFSSRNFYPMNVMAESEAVVLHISKELILYLCQSNTHFMGAFLKEISDKTLLLADKIDAISLKTIRQKIIDFLRYEYSIQKSSTLKIPIAKKDLAERFGVHRTSLSRELNKMREDGLLEFNSKTITIKALELL